MVIYVFQKLRANRATKFVSLAVNNLEVKRKQRAPVRKQSCRVPDVPGEELELYDVSQWSVLSFSHFLKFCSQRVQSA